jgi:Protein of unknown function (DUF3043)
MSVFRRRDAGAGGAVDEAATDEARSGNSQSAAERQAGGGSATTPAKGRPTPRRSEAERRRRQPYTAPADRKSAARQSRTRDRGERSRKYEAMKRGEEWALAPRDKGPVKALARDYVDSKRRISEYYMYILLVLLVILLLRNTALDAIVYPLVLVLVVVMVVEGFFISRAVKKLAAQRYPGESTSGVTRYAIMRTLQIRRFRMPAPRVGPGAEV